MLSVLVIEDNDDHFSLIESALLSAMPSDVTIDNEVELMTGLKALEQHDYDICLCNLQLPDSPIDTTLETLKLLQSATPLIVLTSLNSTDTSKELLQYGIQDFLPKEDLSPTLLNRMCIYAIERKKQHLALQLNNADMQTFCASLSHDFKGHIRRVHGIADLLQTRLIIRIYLCEEELKWFDLIKDGTLGISSLVEGLGQFLSADQHNKHLEEINLSTLFATLRQLILDTTNKKTDIIIDENLPLIQGNTKQLTILFHNLITNAIKYNENDPQIRVQSQLDHKNNICHISIQDNGIGINQKYFSTIFSPFKRLHSESKYAGSGLGLSIVKRIVDRHDGDIHIESEEGKGSIFRVSLPLKPFAG